MIVEGVEGDGIEAFKRKSFAYTEGLERCGGMFGMMEVSKALLTEKALALDRNRSVCNTTGANERIELSNFPRGLENCVSKFESARCLSYGGIWAVRKMRMEDYWRALSPHPSLRRMRHTSWSEDAVRRLQLVASRKPSGPQHVTARTGVIISRRSEAQKAF